MRIFIFRYDKEAIESLGQRMDWAAKSGVPDVRDHEMVCDSVTTLLKMASAPKFEIFDAIISRRPESLYELAQVLGKDQGQVFKDAKSLEAMGIIKLIPTKENGREKLKPEALYDKIVFEMEPKQLAQSA